MLLTANDSNRDDSCIEQNYAMESSMSRINESVRNGRSKSKECSLQTTCKPRKLFSLVLVTDKSKQHVLLGYKKRGFGAGKWNGFGGKLDEGETMIECARRELREECGLIAKDLHQFAIATFESDQDSHILEVHYYFTNNCIGSIHESDEMRPEWFSVNELPFDQMWDDEELWFPLFLQGVQFTAHFKRRQDRIVSFYLFEHTKKRSLLVKESAFLQK